MTGARSTSFVVPLDGSRFAEGGLRPAAAFASRICERDGAGGARMVLVTHGDPDDGDLRTYLETQADRFRPSLEVDVVFADGVSPAEGILATLAERAPALLCMTTHGHGGLRSTITGSVAEEVLTESSAPVVLVGPEAQTVPIVGEVAHLVVCSDDTETARAVLEPAAAWADALDLRPVVVEVVGPDEAVAPPDAEPSHAVDDAAAARLRDQAARWPGAATPAVEVLHGAERPDVVAELAEQLPAGLVAVTSRARRSLARMVSPDFSGDLVRRAPCPVLVVPVPDDE